MNYKIAILDMLNQKRLPYNFAGFYPLIRNLIMAKGEKILSRLDKLSKEEKASYYVRVYNMTKEGALDKVLRDEQEGTLVQ